ncbi:MAG: tRNA (adenosine(37)-N6)-threonylcarbamoyltransferase complex dimerization subunit type 1 TsaB [Candidatus Nanopelagicaceae bacterium]|nr:tRNA (adenosine(37)-N6)-threonylcarbamoyltransferase complex dimerization subunit type 1 TsaB [Candidatus Nanopelagicaceae bacterium]
MGRVHPLNSLVIDTSTTRTSCALFNVSELLFEGHHDGAIEHAEALPKLVAEALKIEEKIDQVVIGMGPGPFTGLRVGIVFGQTFATARNISWVGVCSLDGIDIDSQSYIVATDARRKEIYWAHYQDGERVEGPFVGKSEELATKLEKKFGFGFTEPLYPSPHLLLAKSISMNFREPFYLRRPDAVPTSERS